MCSKLHRWTSLPCAFSSTAFCVVLVLSGLIQSTSYGQKDHAQPRHWTHWMHGGEVDLEKHGSLLTHSQNPGSSRGPVGSSHSSAGHGGCKNMEASTRLLDQNLGGKHLKRGAQVERNRRLRQPMDCPGHSLAQEMSRFTEEQAGSTAWFWIRRIRTIGMHVHLLADSGILWMPVSTGRCWASMPLLLCDRRLD